jgi:hypothetical protein
LAHVRDDIWFAKVGRELEKKYNTDSLQYGNETADACTKLTRVNECFTCDAVQ